MENPYLETPNELPVPKVWSPVEVWGAYYNGSNLRKSRNIKFKRGIYKRK